jgi:hypothetical protein
MSQPTSGLGPSRRGFLLTTGLAATGLAASPLTGPRPRAESCIFLNLVGGPSQIDTWDPKPSAPSDYRSPFRAISTTVPGIHLCEHFPLMAQRARHFALVRSVFHDEAPIHEVGHQLLQTGHLYGAGPEKPHVGAQASAILGRRNGSPAFVVLPGPIENTGVSIGHGQSAGGLGADHDPCCVQPGGARFEALCLEAVRQVEAGARVVAVNMFTSVFNEVTWDCHADGGSLATTLDDYADALCPTFDRGFSRLLDTLASRGLLASTLVVAAGEMGRTPRRNGRGGRDHWPGVWTVLFAGGGVRGGQAVGSSDRLGAEPRDRPVHASQVAATVRAALGLAPEGAVVEELFR